MRDANDLLNIVKRAALEAVDASKPCDFCYGKVTSAAPLKISVDQKMTLGAAQLVLARNVTDFQTAITIDGEKKQATVHNALQVGDEVVLVKKKGGQKYLVLDRMVSV